MLELLFHLVWKIKPPELSCNRKKLQGFAVTTLCLTHATLKHIGLQEIKLTCELAYK